MRTVEAAQTTKATSSTTTSGMVLQRKGACGGSAGFSGERNECKTNKLLGQPLLKKLAIGAPGDAYEQEADRVAEQVMKMPERPAKGRLNDKVDRPLIQRRASASTGTSVGVSPPIVQEVLAQPGQPLDRATRAFFEPRFGYDFSHVRVHTDASAAESSRSVNALAYTVGNHVVLGAKSMVPASREGRQLIAHELAHVVQQSDSDGLRVGQTNLSSLLTVVSGSSVSTRSPGLLIQRQKEGTSSGVDTVHGTVFILSNVGGGFEVEKELLRRGILKPGDYDAWGMLNEGGYYFGQSSGAGPTYRYYRVLDALWIRNESGEITGYKVISYLQGPSRGHTPSQSPQTKPMKIPAAPEAIEKPRTQKPSKPSMSAPQAAQPTAPTDAKTTDQMQAEYNTLPESIKELLRGGGGGTPENTAQLMRIANKLKQLQPEDLALYKLLAKKLAADLDAFERSVDFFIQFKAQIKAQADAEKTKETKDKEPTLEEKLSKTWSQFDESKLSEMDTGQKEALAREIAAQQRNIQLEHMATHPGETAVGMAEGIVRLDKTAEAIAEDVRDAADGNKGAYTRIAGAVGAYNKYLAAAASIVFVALLFVPGVNLIELAAAGLAVAAASIVLSVAESELRIKAAGEAKTPEEFKAETAKSAAAQTQAVVAAAMVALTLAMKIIGRIPLPGRYQNVGAALNAAQTALLEKSGIGPAWQSIKTDLLRKLRSSKQGLPEALADQTKVVSDAAKVIEGMSGDEFVNQLAAGDPKLADLGISPDQAKAIQQISGTPEGKRIPEQLRQDSLRALQDAPVEARKKVDQFLNNVDDSIAKIEKAQNQEQLKSAVDDATSRLSAEEQARQAATDEQVFLKRRSEGARRTGVREQAQKKLEALQAEKSETQAEIARLEKELSDANVKVNRLKTKVLSSPEGSKERANALQEFKAAKEALEDLREADELGGYREERSKQNKAEKAILESLELNRPGLWQSTKDKIDKAAKKNSAGKFLDANTGEVIEGEPVYGHIRGREHRRLVLKASEKGMTQEQFTEWVNDHPEWFQLETKANNESHAYELKGIDGWEKIE